MLCDGRDEGKSWSFCLSKRPVLQLLFSPVRTLDNATCTFSCRLAAVGF